MSPQNTTYASYEGILFTKDLSALLFIPENMEHTAYLPDTTKTVPAGALSHSAQLTFVSIGESCSTYATENGILYSKDKTTLIATPAGYKDSVVIPQSVTTIASYAFAGCNLKSIVATGSITSIDATAFSDATKAEATIVIPSSPDFDTLKAVWVQAGFTHFQTPATPGDTTQSDTSQDTGHLVYELQDDYTLSVAWKGNSVPDANLTIPSSAELSSVTYRVSTVADSAFENCTSLKSVVIPASISSIGDSAFKGCSQLANITLSEGLTSLGDSAFEGTALEQVILPQSVTAIGDRALANNATLTRIVALDTIDTVVPSALEGCSGVSILTPYKQDGLYSWTPGIAALGNHIEPYGFTNPDKPLDLKQEQSLELFDAATLFVPVDLELTYSYPATCVSVDADGVITGKAPGSVDVVALLTLDNIELARGVRSVEVAGKDLQQEPEEPAFGAKPTPPSFVPSLPLTSSALLLEGSEITLRGIIASGQSGTCSWDITDGVLTIKPTNGSEGTLASFDGDPSSVPWYSSKASITAVDIKPGVNGGTSISWMFQDCANLTNANLLNFDTSGVLYMNNVFSNCTSLASLDLSSFITNNTTYMIGMFSGCSKLVGLDLSNFNTASVVNMGAMFMHCSSLEELNLSGFNTSSVTEMTGVFYGCSSLTSLDLSSFNTLNVLNLSDMFAFCSSLKALNLSNFNTVNAINLGSMFFDCLNLSTLDLSSFNTANVTGMNNVFNGCSGLTSLDISNFSTARVTTMGAMFANCPSLTDLDLSNFDTKNVTDMSYMFYNSSSIATLDLSGFNTTNVTNSTGMFNYTQQLSTIKIGSAYDLDLPQKAGTNTQGATYSGKWISQSNGALHDYNEDFKNKADTYTAQQDLYVLSFSTQGGSLPPTHQLLAPGAKATTVANPTKADYTFNGWYTDPACINAWSFTTSTMPTRNLTLYAGWLSNTCTVTFDGNGGEPTKTTKTVNRGSTLGENKPADPTKTGSRLLGWYTQVTGGTAYNFNSAVTSDFTLWAHWEAIPYTLTFDSQGGAPIPTTQTLTYGQTTQSVTDPVYAGYTFKGWFTEKGGLGTCWYPGVTTMPANNTTLYAHWTGNPYTIFFDPNGSLGPTMSQDMTHGVKATLKPNTFIPLAGSRFVGWNTRADGLGDNYLDQAEVFDLAQGATDITLYAQWTENTYTIEFVPNPGTHPISGTMAKIPNVKYSQVLTLPSSSFSSSDGYVFAYWTGDSEGTGTRYLDASQVSKLGGSTRDGELVRLYAQWKGSPYTITYDPTTADVEGSLDPQVCSYGTWETLASSGFTKPNSTLSGWALNKTDAEHGFADYKLGDQVLDLAGGTDTVVLYAVWTEQINVSAPINPTITLDAQGKPSADTSTYFESNTSKAVRVVSATCSPITGEQGTIAVFPKEAQWDNIAVALKSTTSATNRLFLTGLTTPLQGLSVPAKSGSTKGELPVTINLTFLDDVDITYNPDSSHPVAQIAFVFEMGA